MAKAKQKTVPTKQSVAAFLKTVTHPTRQQDAQTALRLFKQVTGATPKMWGPSIIGFGRYNYHYESGRSGESFTVGFSPRKAHMVLYIMGMIPEDDPLRSKLGKFRSGRGCLYVNKFDDIDLDVLEKMIEKSYRLTCEKYL